MPLNLSHKEIVLRGIGEEDLPKLCEIYSSTREAEMQRLTDWTQSQKTAFLMQQFSYQHTYYQQNYNGAGFYMIRYKKEDIGRLYIDTNFKGKEIRIIDIALLPKWRAQGIGTRILEDIKAKGKTLHRPVSIHVESFNPAMNLYKRLGFRKVSETNGVYHLLEWRAA
ncbi:GNAT family N-acetyltransferase [Marinilongibacter aquaticus]|uniref:GNAT family N-acetyltransferase n=1 Tax=Marinilongibacter aquaticus TaxID=2975157 RepID=UPI0021BD5C00|nr:GNAT family N-acetyltransferase [Marinilongibacter aquaticus]UBM59614.1 GNAT family N-acetyltransferase [Marinilongibacter aquaticus]